MNLKPRLGGVFLRCDRVRRPRLPQLPAHSLLVVIPAKAGIQEGKGAVMKGRQVLPDSALGCHTCCHSRKAGMDD